MYVRLSWPEPIGAKTLLTDITRWTESSDRDSNTGGFVLQITSRARYTFWVFFAIFPATEWCFSMKFYLFISSFFSAKRAIVTGFARLVRLLVRHEISYSNISKTFSPRSTTFYRDIHTDIVYSCARYDISIYFRSEVIGENKRKDRLRRFRVEFIKNASN